MSMDIRRATAEVGDLVGRDLVRVRRIRSRVSARPIGWLIAAGLIAALGLVSLRIDILRVRYGLAEAIGQEKSLQEQKRQRTAQVETLRNPSRLAELAGKRGFARPEHVLELQSGRKEVVGP